MEEGCKVEGGLVVWGVTGTVLVVGGVVEGVLVVGGVVEGVLVVGGVVEGVLVVGGVVEGVLVVGGVVEGELVVGGVVEGELVVGGVVEGELVVGGVVEGELVVGGVVEGELVVGGVVEEEFFFPVKMRQLGVISLAVVGKGLKSITSLVHLVINSCLISFGVSDGSSSSKSATAPDTKGVAIEVPLFCTRCSSELCAADKTYCPGANTSTHFP